MRRRGFDRNFPENCNLICFGLGLSPRNENNNGNFKNVVILPLWCYYRGKILSFLFLCACKNFSFVKSMRTRFASVSTSVLRACAVTQSNMAYV